MKTILFWLIVISGGMLIGFMTQEVFEFFELESVWSLFVSIPLAFTYGFVMSEFFNPRSKRD